MKLTHTLATLSIAALGFTACSAEEMEAYQDEQEATAEDATEEVERIEVPDLTGTPLDEAKDQLDELELDADEYDISEDDKSVWRDSNWEVTEQDPAAGEQVEPDTEILLGVQKIEDEDADEEEPEEQQTTADGLDTLHAQVACTTEAENQAYPDDLKIHTVMGKKQENINDDEIRFLWETTLTSQAGGELSGELLCVATGDNDNTTVELELR